MARRKRRPEGSPAAALPAPAPPRRIESIDALRGIAIIAMIAYHFTFDLRVFGLIRADFERDPFWLTTRGSIVTAFLLIVGLSLVLAFHGGIDRGRFFRRIGLIALCALVASAGSYAVFPQTFIYFGILHCIVVASLLAWPLVNHPRAALAAGIAVILAGVAWSHPFFDVRPTSWIGFGTTKPPTQDFVPLAPWAGVVLVGIALGHALYERGFAPLAPLARTPGALRWMGRHSLAIYMVHQPILMGLLWGWLWAFPRH